MEWILLCLLFIRIEFLSASKKIDQRGKNEILRLIVQYWFLISLSGGRFSKNIFFLAFQKIIKNRKKWLFLKTLEKLGNDKKNSTNGHFESKEVQYFHFFQFSIFYAIFWTFLEICQLQVNLVYKYFLSEFKTFWTGHPPSLEIENIEFSAYTTILLG